MYNFLTATNDSPLGAISKYFVILESISSIIFSARSNTKENYSPIGDGNIAKKLILDLKSTMEQFLEINSIGDSEINKSLILQRLEKINDSTNIDKLTKSFELIGLSLSKDEKRIIGLRNKFLHGSIIDSIDDTSLSEESVHIKVKLQTLIAAIILKYYGHKGKIINYCYIVNSYTRRAESEPSYLLL